MSEKNIACVAKELGIRIDQVAAVARLFEEGATVPFIARYRKEVTGNLDEVMIIAVRDRLEQLRELDQRRETILKSLAEQNVLTPELEAAVKSAETLSALEDIYLPYRPKKRTRAMIAREKGLEPLALGIFNGELGDAGRAAAAYVDAEKGVADVDAALQGARDIIAEMVSEHAEARAEMRAHFTSQAQMSAKLVKGREKDAATYRDYFDWAEPASKAPSHRILAVLRAAEEGVLNVHFLPDEDTAVEILKRRFVARKNPCAAQLELAVHDGYRRLMGPSLETETRNLCKQRADEEAIRVFAGNVRELLMASPLGEKTVLALDPGLRTGCKLVCLSRQGSLLFHTAIYPLEPHNRKEEAGAVIRKLCAEHRVEAIAVGNGTGGREALAFCKSLKEDGINLTMVSESGASVYSASEVARREFADYDVTVRGAVSIGRRLMDPLAELVKIDPKAIGVGQYQHDVDQKALKQSLEMWSAAVSTRSELKSILPAENSCVLGPGFRRAWPTRLAVIGMSTDRSSLAPS